VANIPLAVLRDQATTTDRTFRCSVTPNPTGATSTVTTASGVPCKCSIRLMTRTGLAPDVGATVTVSGVTGKVAHVAVRDLMGPWQRSAEVFIATRTDIVGALPDTVTVYPSEATTDAYGTPVRSPVRSPATTGTVLAARIEPAASSESHTDGQRRDQTWTLTVDTDLLALDVDAYADVVDEDGITWRLVGDPLVHTDPTGGRWSEARIRRTGDGAA
jgi:hypothetical protein